MDLKKNITTASNYALMMVGSVGLVAYAAVTSVPVLINNASQAMVNKAFN